MSVSRAYQLVDAARVSTIVEVAPKSEAQARELAPLLNKPELLRDAWQEANADGTPTALKVREAVARWLPPVTEEAREKQRRWAATMNVLDGLAHFDRDPVPEQADAEAALIDEDIAMSRGQTVTPERLRTASAWAALLADALDRRNS